ncbi:MAG: hypothetical protein COB16_12815 [Rhodobacteraceae bacterium]|nr:MAG: hypothetical protein COB16_12815 [Paracoccaceae bacterium]
MELKLPYVFKERMPSCNFRYRFQRHGVKKTIKGEPGSPEFLASYTAILDGVEEPEKIPDAKGSISWLVGLFLKDFAMRVEAGLVSPLTLKGHQHHLGRLVNEFGRKNAYMPRGKLV